MTKEIRQLLPPLYATEHDEDPIVVCKFFYPWHDWVWYVLEYDGQDTFFGLVDGFEPELGYFSLSELQNTRDKMGCPIERDQGFQPCKLSKVVQESKDRRAMQSVE